MRKFWVAGTVSALILALAAVAVAQQTNTYTVSGSTSPATKGSKKRPVPVQLKFNYTVGEINGNRPDVVKKYSIRISGMRANTNSFPGCTVAQLQAKKAAGCRRALVGTGKVRAAAGNRADPSDKSAACNLKLSVYNARKSKATLLLQGGPDRGPDDTCPIEFGESNGSIPANFVRNALGTALEFEVPDNILHPLPTLSSAVTSVTSTIARKVRRVRGKRIGFFEVVGGCRRKKRAITVTFTPESGPSRNGQGLAKC